jgi:amino acid transporter
MEEPALHRRLGLAGASVTNMLVMIGVGPFLTIPLLLSSMRGPQAMWGWVLGAVISVADGLVWAELGAALPHAGGGYRYLLEAYGPRGPGRLASFLYLWAMVIGGPMMFASGALGFSQYAAYLWPAMTPWQGKAVAVAVCLACTALIWRRIDKIGRLGLAFAAAVLAACLWIILEGIAHGHVAGVAPAGATHAGSPVVWAGLGAATLYALYDYGGYATVCQVGGEVRRPERTIPASILISVGVVAVLYVAMSLSVVTAMPWREAARSSFIGSDFIARFQGRRAAEAMTVLVLVSAFASVFGGMLGLSRIPFAAARDGRFFRAFARLHPTGEFPTFAVAYVGLASAACCLLDLEQAIKATMVILSLVANIPAVFAPTLLRRRGARLPFRMWLYPLPSLIALAGWTYIVGANGWSYLTIAGAALAAGVAAYLWRARRAREWPWEGAITQAVPKAEEAR